MGFKEIKVTDIKDNLIEKVSREWMLICAGDTADNCNMMTASWGFFGEIWNKHCAITLIRPQRYTLPFVDSNDRFALCFFGNNKEPHKICGYKSGREVNKIAETGLTPVVLDGTIYFEEAETVMICRKLYVSEINKDGFIDKECLKNYNNDFHKLFIAEIEKVLIK